MTCTPNRGVNPWSKTTKQMAGSIILMGIQGKKSITYLQLLSHVPPRVQHDALPIREYLIPVNTSIKDKHQRRTSRRKPPAKMVDRYRGNARWNTHDTVSRGEVEHDCIYGKDNGYELLRPAVYGFKIHLLSAGPWEHGAKLEPDKEPAEREGKAKDPEHQGCADRPDRPEDRRWSGKYPSADNCADASRNVRILFDK
jgi:hypothetical protein